MNEILALALWALATFQAKHFFCDFVLAPRYGLDAGTRHWEPRRALYALLHAIGTVPAVLLLSGTGEALLIVPLLDLVLAYHLAVAQARLAARTPFNEAPLSQALFGLSQLLHQLFYLGAVAALT